MGSLGVPNGTRITETEKIMDVTMIISLLGGLGLFLYGMETMSDGLKNSSADALRRALEKATSNPIKGFLLGFLITAVIQSSTATLVLAAGLIGAGIMTLRQGITIAMGANVGTTVTGQIVRLMDLESGSGGVMKYLQPSTFAPVAIVIGIVLIMFIKRRGARNIGLIAMGFGILFIGLMTMTTSMKPLANSEAFLSFVVEISDVPILSLLMGLVLTLIVQSSSASVGILQTLSSTGVMNFRCSYAYILGAAIGTSLVAMLLCMIGGRRDSKRLGVVNLIVSCIGAVLFMIVMWSLGSSGVLGSLWEKSMTSGDIANFQMIFKLSTALVLLPFAGKFEKLSKKIIPDRKETYEKEDEARIAKELSVLDPHLYTSPALALANAENVVIQMGDIAYKNYCAAVEQIFSCEEERTDQIQFREELLDRMADAMNRYLVGLWPHLASEHENDHLTFLMQNFELFEHIGDMSQNINENAIALKEHGLALSEAGMQEIKLLSEAVEEALDLAIGAFITRDPEMARKVEPLEEVVDDMGELYKQNHMGRLQRGDCDIQTGLYFVDMILNFERISDQASDMAVYTIALRDRDVKGREHEYLHNMHHGFDPDYWKLFEEYRTRFLGETPEPSAETDS